MRKFCLLSCLFLSSIVVADEEDTSTVLPQVLPNVMDMARKNSNWKVAVVTGEEEQIVFMNVSKATNPDNEIGMEVHTFDQTILIVSGSGKAVMNGKETLFNEGDMIFIPKGVAHNVVSFGKELKLISIYADTDIKPGSVFATKAAASD